MRNVSSKNILTLIEILWHSFDVIGHFSSFPVSRSDYSLRDLGTPISLWLSPIRAMDSVHGSEGGFVELEDHHGGAPLASRAVPRLFARP